jgi:hypothetical protein
MKSEAQGKWIAAAATAVCLVATTAGSARAADEDGKSTSEGGECSEGEHHGEQGEEKHAEGKHEESAMLGADLVLGWGKVPFAVANQTGSGASPQTPTYTGTDKTSSNVQSLILSGGVEVVEHVGVGVRVPLTFATFNPDGSASRSVAAVGNVEIEGEYGGRVAKGLRLVAALGVALPTAPGTEIPAGLVNQPASSADQSGWDRYSLSKAAAAARGYEDNALFEPQRFGLIPKLGLLYRVHGLSIEPYVKVENLIGTSSSLANSYVGEFVGALRVGYWIHKEFELAVKAWFNTGFAGGDEDKQTSAALEPQLVLRFGPVRPYAGVIIPLAGPPNSNGFIGIRLGVAAAF